MLKYISHYVSYQEVPDETSLVINITGCELGCEGCHSPELQSDEGEELNIDVLDGLIKRYEKEITCVCFMGGDFGYGFYMQELLCFLDDEYSHIKTCLYTGNDIYDINPYILLLLDYVKFGPYKKELGGLSSPSTNQRFFANGVDITSRFWKE